MRKTLSKETSMKRQCFLVVSLIAWSSCNAAEQKTWLEFPSGLSHTLVQESNGAAAARIPAAIKVAPSGEAKFGARIFDVYFEGARSETLATEFEAKVTPATDTHDVALVVIVKSSANKVRPGTYSVGVHLEPFSEKGKVLPQLVSLTLHRLAPEIEVRGTIVLGQVEAINGNLEPKPGELQLIEKSHKADATNLTFTDYRDSQSSRIADSGTVQVVLGEGKHENVLSAGGIRKLSVLPRGEFPLGTTSGKIDIRSSELSAPVTATYQVYARRNLGWLAALATAGIICGLIIRVSLQNLRQRLQARIAASETMQQIANYLADIDDTTFRDAVVKIRKNIRTASQSTDPDSIAAAVKAANDNLVAELSAVEQRLKPLVESTNALQSVLDRNWMLPPQSQALLQQALVQLRGVKELLKRRNTGEADAELSQMMKDSVYRLSTSLGKWSADLGKYLSVLAAHPPPLPSDAQTGLKQFADEVTGQASWPYVMSASIDGEMAKASLEKAHGFFQKAEAVLHEIDALSSAFIEWVAEQLHVDANSPETNTVRNATQKEAEAIRDDLFEPSTGRIRLQSSNSELRQTWLQFIRIAAPAIDESKVSDLLSRGAWEEAIALAKSAPPNTTAAAIRVSASPMPQNFTIPAVSPTPDRNAVFDLELPPLTGSVSERRLMQVQSNRAAALQSAFFAILLICGLYAVYVDSWVGTYKEMFAIFLLAFGIDLTSDSVLAELKKKT
jgi:hypothetical protein